MKPNAKTAKPGKKAPAKPKKATAKPKPKPKPKPSVATKTKAAKVKEPAIAKKAATPARRTQAERRSATRQRLIDATLQCLTEDGYAGTTINRIVERAEVSHGASGHYFPSKNAMIRAAGEELMRQAYRRWGAALLNVTDAEDRLDALLTAAWQDVFNDRRSDAVLELVMAGKKDADLREHMQPMMNNAMKVFRQSAEHFFVAKDPEVDIYDMMLLTQWLFRGMAIDQRYAPDPSWFSRYLKLWRHLMAEYVATRPGVTTPPSR